MLAFESARTLAAKLRAREIRCRELLESCIARSEAYEKTVNAIVVRDLARARERARAADKALDRGEHWGPPQGGPMTIKESSIWQEPRPPSASRSSVPTWQLPMPSSSTGS